MLQGLDISPGCGSIVGLDTFRKHFADPEMVAISNSLEIEVHDAIMLINMVDDNGTGELDFDDFITSCTTLRGGAETVYMEQDDPALHDYQTLAHQDSPNGEDTHLCLRQSRGLWRCRSTWTSERVSDFRNELHFAKRKHMGAGINTGMYKQVWKDPRYL